MKHTITANKMTSVHSYMVGKMAVKNSRKKVIV